MGVWRDRRLEPHDLVVVVALDAPTAGEGVDDGETMASDAAGVRAPDHGRIGRFVPRLYAKLITVDEDDLERDVACGMTNRIADYFARQERDNLVRIRAAPEFEHGGDEGSGRTKTGRLRCEHNGRSLFAFSVGTGHLYEGDIVPARP